jgi:hypothetical protein
MLFAVTLFQHSLETLRVEDLSTIWRHFPRDMIMLMHHIFDVFNLIVTLRVFFHDPSTYSSSTSSTPPYGPPPPPPDSPPHESVAPSIDPLSSPPHVFEPTSTLLAQIVTLQSELIYVLRQ